MQQTIIRYGLISGITIVVFMILGVIVGGDNFDTWELFGFAGMILSIIGVFVGIKSYRDNQPGGVLSFKHAFLVGLGIVAMASLLVGIYTALHVGVFDPDYSDKYYAFELAKVQESGATKAEIKDFEQSMGLMKEYGDNAFIQGIVMFVMTFIMGMVVALIAAAIMKKSPPERA